MSKARRRPVRRRTRTTPNPNTGTADNFFGFFATGATTPQDIISVMTLFSPDSGGTVLPFPTKPTSPSLGIAHAGPQFFGQTAISLLFNKLITSFPNLKFTPSVFVPNSHPPVPLYCYSQDGNTIAVQATLATGPFMQAWFSSSEQAYSKPLSDIEPDQHSVSYVPAYAAFTFDGNNLIKNLAIFMDRWQMAVDLYPGVKGNSGVRPFPTPSA